MKEDIFKSGIKNELTPKASWHNVKKIIGKRINLTILNLLLFGAALIIIGMIISKCPSCPEQECPEIEQEECPECEVCEVIEPEKQLRVVSTYVCIDGTIAGDPKDCDIKEDMMKQYVCDDGTIKNTAKECIKTLELDTDYEEQDNHLLLAVDDIEYDMKGDDWGTVTKISYAVKNFAESPILPKIQIKVYNESDPVATKADTRHTIKINKTLDRNEFVQDVEDVYISFKGTNITAKFVLLNGLEELSQAKVVLERPLD